MTGSSEATHEDLPTNWGRWGSDDELGTLNHITDESRLRAASSVKTGRSVSLAMPVLPVLMAGGGPAGAVGTVMPAPVLQIMNYNPTPPAYVEVLVLNTHNLGITHIDAPVHVPVDGKVYPGVPVEEAVHGGRAHHGTTSPYVGGVSTRGILLDLSPNGRLDPGHGVTAADLEVAETHAGVRVSSGDAVIVRGGWTVHEDLAEPLPGMTLDAVRWLAQREVSMFVGDIGDRPPGAPGDTIPMHYVALALLGMPIIDNAQVQQLAEICEELNQYEFLLTLGAMPILGVTGVPVNPIATF